jgi:MFS family permease
MADGFRFVASDSFLRTVIPISMLYNFLFAPMFAVVIPVFVREEFNNAGAFGIIIASFGAGAAIGTLAFGAVGHRIGRYQLFLFAVVFIAIGFWFVALSTSIWMSTLGMAVIGLAIGPTNAVAMVILQIRVPEAMLGRVMGLMIAFGAFAAPLGVLLSGFFIEEFSYRAALFIGGFGTTIAALWTLFSPSLRRLSSELDDEMSSARGETDQSVEAS